MPRSADVRSNVTYYDGPKKSAMPAVTLTTYCYFLFHAIDGLGGAIVETLRRWRSTIGDIVQWFCYSVQRGKVWVGNSEDGREHRISGTA